MPVAALPGNVRLRAFQIGLQTTFGVPVVADRRMGLTFTPSVDPHWTFPSSDTGTLDRALPPYRLAGDFTGSAAGPLCYDDASYLWAALTKAGVTPSGATAKDWTFQPASTSQDAFELFTAEWGDDTADRYRFSDGVLDKLALTWPEDLGPVTVAADWRFSKVDYSTWGTLAALQVDPAPEWVYAADSALYLDSTAGGIGVTQLTNTMHGGSLTVTNNIDVKRFTNGSNTRFQAAGYGRGARLVTATFNFAKSSQEIAEVVNWLNASPVERFLAVRTVSPTIITGAIPYSHDVRLAGFWTARSEGTYATANTTASLTCEGFLDQTLTYPFKAEIVNKIAAL